MSGERTEDTRLRKGSGDLTIAVLAGGIGAERQVSLQSGKCVAAALAEAGANVMTADVAPDRLDVLDDEAVDVFFPALHGQFGEDGRLQQILEDRGLTYTGSGPRASELAFDKVAGKDIFSAAGVAVPAGIEYDPETNVAPLRQQLRMLGGTFVVKPIRQGSSVGVAIVKDVDLAVTAARTTHGRFGDCMIEQFIAGREITVGILDRRPLPIIEIRSKTGFYDYQAKYLDDDTEYLFETIDDPALVSQIRMAAVTCFDALGCRGFARVDFVLGDDGVPYALELNTIPGFTTHSLLPKAAAQAGLPMSHLCMRIVDAALKGKDVPAPS